MLRSIIRALGKINIYLILPCRGCSSYRSHADEWMTSTIPYKFPSSNAILLRSRWLKGRSRTFPKLAFAGIMLYGRLQTIWEIQYDGHCLVLFLIYSPFTHRLLSSFTGAAGDPVSSSHPLNHIGASYTKGKGENRFHSLFTGILCYTSISLWRKLKLSMIVKTHWSTWLEFRISRFNHDTHCYPLSIGVGFLSSIEKLPVS